MNCERVCPANVDYEKIIDAGRAVTRKQSSWFENFQQSLLLFALSKSLGRKCIKICISIFKSFGLHRVFSSARLFSLLPDTSSVLQKFNAHPSDKSTNRPANGPTVAILNSCAGDLVNDETLNAARLMLSKLNCEVVEQKQTLCCGALHQHTGDLKTAKELRQNFISSFDQQNADYLVSLATGCGAQIERYAKFDNTGLENDSAQRLIQKHSDANEFVLQQLKNSKLRFKPLDSKIYIHKPCSQAQMPTDDSTVEQLLNYIPEAELVTFEDQLSCCGAGGINNISQSRLADQLIENKVLELRNSSANYLVSSNIGCALHFQAKLRQHGIPVQVCHPISLLAQQVL
jgi:glycolate oxidase iron-sulfur subunit